MNSISTFDITKYPLLDVLKDIKTGCIQLPDFQRDWVWDDAHVRRAGLFPLSKVFCFWQWRSDYSKYWQYDASQIELINTLEVEVIKKFDHYQMPVIQLRESLPKEAVCQVFEDTNTSGCDLNFFDLMTASYCAGDFSLRDDWQKRETRLKSHKVLRLLRNTDFIQAVTLVATYTRHQKALDNGCPQDKLPAVSCRRSSILQLSTQEYMSWAESMTRGFEKAARFLHGQKIFDASDLAYPIQLVALAAILTVSGEHSSFEMPRLMLEQWFWCGVFGEMYTGGTDARVARDLLEVPAWLSGGRRPSTHREAYFATSRLHGVRRRHGAVYKGLSVLLRREGAVDWSTGEEINDVLYFEEQIDSHHIFPVAWCKKQGIDPNKYNCLVNRTPLSAKTNKLIGGEAPSIYLRRFSGEGIYPARLDDMLRTHAIDAQTLRQDDFEAFFAARTRRLMKLIEEVMGKSLVEVSYQRNTSSNRNGHHPEMVANGYQA